MKKPTILLQRGARQDIAEYFDFADDRELGGLLLGHFDTNRNRIVVDRVLPVPEGDLDEVWIDPGDYLHFEQWADHPWEQDSRFVGDLHSHQVFGRAEPSNADLAGWRFCAKTPGQVGGWASLIVSPGAMITPPGYPTGSLRVHDWGSLRMDAWVTSAAGDVRDAQVTEESETGAMIRQFEADQAKLRHAFSAA